MKKLYIFALVALMAFGATMNVHANRVDIGTLSDAYKIQDGDTLYGIMPTSNEQWLLTDFGEDVTVYLEEVQIIETYYWEWPGIECHGNTTIVLIGGNYINGHKVGQPAIYIENGYTLTITGEGSLYAFAGKDAMSVSHDAPAIGGVPGSDCGNIHITGECYVEAYGADDCPGIGGVPGKACGTITIEPSCYYIYAEAGSTAPGAIGKAGGSGSSCAGVTICGKDYGDICATDLFQYEREVVGVVDGIKYTFDTYAKVAYVSEIWKTGSINIPATVEYKSEDYQVTKILTSAFYNRDAVTDVTLPEGLEEIAQMAFVDCDNLGDIAIPSTVTKIEISAFRQNKKMENITVHPDNPNYCDVDGVLFTKDKKTLLAYPIARTADLYNIPAGVEDITMSAFYAAPNLTAVVFPEGLQIIGSEVFRECPLLETLTFPSTLGYIGDNAFYACPKLTNIDLSKTAVGTIASSAFGSCTGLKNLVLPESLTYIDDEAFNSCSALNDVTCMAITPPKLGIDVFDGTPKDKLTVPYATSTLYKGQPEWKDFSDMKEEPLPSPVLIDGINYALKDDWGSRTATVLPLSEGKYTGEITIPTSVKYNGVDFTVTSIGENAFLECDGVTAVTLPDGLEAINEEAFSGCKLTSIILPDGLLGIGYKAFFYSGLTSVNIPASVTSLHSTAFLSCFNLTAINVDPANATYASDDGVLFSKDMKTLRAYPAGNERTEYTMPSSVTDLEERVFMYAGYLERVTLSPLLTSIPAYAFAGSWLEVINLPASVTNVGESAFEGCTNVNRIICEGATPPGLDVDVFYLIDKDKVPVFVPEANVTDYNTAANWSEFANFYGTPLAQKQVDGVWYEFDLYYAEATVVANPDGVTKYTGEITIPETAESWGVDFAVTTIGESAFDDCWDLESVSLPSSLTTIETAAITTTRLSSITIPASVTTIASQSLDGIYITSIEVEEANANYASVAGVLFNKAKTKLIQYPLAREGKYEIPTGVTHIVEDALNGCVKLEQLYIPSSVTNIGDYALAQMSGLKIIKMENDAPASITMGTNVFYNDHFDEMLLFVPDGAEADYVADGQWGQFKHILGSYKEIEIDGIKYTIFDNMTALLQEVPTTFEGDLVIPEKVTYVADFVVEGIEDAFLNCDKLTSISVPAGVTNISIYGFSNNPALTAINVDPANVSYTSKDGVLFDMPGTSLMKYPQGREGAYTVPDGVETISDEAFAGNTHLTAVTLPASLTEIASLAFENCTGLTSITSLATDAPHAGSQAFDNVPKSIPVYVPKDGLASYKADDEWKDFKFITLEDKAEADAVIAKIEAIGTVEYTYACKARIDDARKVYDALSEDAKKVITAEQLKVLTDAEAGYEALKKAALDAVIAKIEAIGTVEYTNACKTKIDDARTAYNDLTTDQQALVDNYDKLTAAEKAYADLKKKAEDKAAADAVIDKINAIGTVNTSDYCKGLIDDARTAYDALNEERKALITAEQLKVLTDAEAKYAELKKAQTDLEAAVAVMGKINDIDYISYTDECKTKIDAARTAYDALTADQKALVDNYSKLTAAEKAYADLKEAAEKEAADKKAAKDVDDLIAAIGTVEYTDASKALIDAARTAYDALTADRKTFVTKLATLEAAEKAYADLKEAAEKEAADKKAAKEVDDLIAAIGTVEYTDASKALIDAARTAYDALNAEQKAFVSTYATLTGAEAYYDTLKAMAEAADDAAAAKAVTDAIDAIGTVTYTDECKGKIDAARAAYEALNTTRQALVTNLATLEAAEQAYADLKEAAEKEAADKKAAKEVDDLIAAIGTVEYTDASKALIDAARAAYDALTFDQLTFVTKLATLEAAEKAYADLKEAAEKEAADKKAAKEVDDLIAAIGTVEYTDASKALIDAARTAYDALTFDQLTFVTKLATLEAAEKAYADLKEAAEKEAADKKAAKDVDDLIAAIGTVEYTDASKALIDAARTAYDALTADQKTFVTTLATLEAAEKTYADLKAAAETVTGTDDVRSDKVQGTKFIRNGILYIEYNGTTYTLRGTRLD